MIVSTEEIRASFERVSTDIAMTAYVQDIDVDIAKVSVYTRWRNQIAAVPYTAESSLDANTAMLFSCQNGNLLIRQQQRQLEILTYHKYAEYKHSNPLKPMYYVDCTKSWVYAEIERRNNGSLLKVYSGKTAMQIANSWVADYEQGLHAIISVNGKRFVTYYSHPDLTGMLKNYSTLWFAFTKVQP